MKLPKCEGCRSKDIKSEGVKLWIKGRTVWYNCPKCKFKKEYRFLDVLIGSDK